MDQRKRAAAERDAEYGRRALDADGNRRAWTPAERQARRRARLRLATVARYAKGRYDMPAQAEPAATPDDLAPLAGTFLDELRKVMP